MLFNSIPFLIFFATVFSVFFLLPPKYRWVLLIGASYFFYMYWNPYFIFLLGFSTLLDFFFGLGIANTKDSKIKRTMLIISIVVNLSLLFVFKYYIFTVESLNFIFGKLGFNHPLPIFQLLLPVGISFYTFHSLSYIIDIYRGIITPEKHFAKYAIYVCFFPLLVAGPIERGSHLLPQLQTNAQRINYQNFVAGFSQAMFGFFKKVVIADSLALYVNSIYNNYQINTGATLLLATYLFAFQFYCDFSGYSDIAVGIAKMMGYDLFANFRMPYFSKNITEFWRRWHISLSSWLRDYLYISLGGNRKGKLITYRNLIITMLLGGLWHGASWNFVIWGALNGLFLAIEKLLHIDNLPANRNPAIRFLSIFVTFNLICATWIFFRSATFLQARTIFREIFFSRHFLTFNLNDKNLLASTVFWIGLMLAFEYLYLRKKSFMDFADQVGLPKILLFNVSLLILIISLGINKGSQFIYFQF